jgi:hypothetical protein
MGVGSRACRESGKEAGDGFGALADLSGPGLILNAALSVASLGLVPRAHGLRQVLSAPEHPANVVPHVQIQRGRNRGS